MRDEEIVYKSCALRTRKYIGKPQRLEGGLSEVANSLTSLQKDSMIMEIKVIENGDAEETNT